MSASRSRWSGEPPVLVLYVSSDQFLELQELIDGATGDPVTTATVEAVLKGSGGSPVSGVPNPLTMSHVASGTYRGLVPDTAVLSVGDRVTAEITADDGANRRGYWRRTLQVEYA